jgi:GT2 family glycosyltransferase
MEPIAENLRILATGRWPTRLPKETAREILGWPTPERPLSQKQHHPKSNEGLVSIILVTSNGFLFTKLCLTALFLNSTDQPYELVLVDNGSEDGTDQFARKLQAEDPATQVILNQQNLGFAAAVNQGLKRASGETLVLLNSDTIVSSGWIGSVVGHLSEPGVGLVGPVTNRCGNEAEIGCSYQTYGELAQFARVRQQNHAGCSFEIPMLSMFCLAMKRQVYLRLGPLDEQFEIGLFEDDDYSLRAVRSGYRVICAEDCFVHHYGQVSFGRSGSAKNYEALLHNNRQRFERKWGVDWKPHRRKIGPRYLDLRERVCQAARSCIPVGARALVISRGDSDLIELLGENFSHFPQGRSGSYAGFYPIDSLACIDHLELLRKRGSSYLVIPETSLWWLEHYQDWKDHLDRNYPRLFNDLDTGIIYRLD